MSRRLVPVQIDRDPFARTTLMRQTVSVAPGTGCGWCGGTRPNARLYVFSTEHDGGRKTVHPGKFCCHACHDAYHSIEPVRRRRG